MALAPLAARLYTRWLRHAPANRGGSTATGSCCRRGTPASSSTPRCTCPATT
jgi:hypothetical protein